MASFRYRDRGASGAGIALSIAAGALAGFVAGVVVAQRAGGFAGLTAKLREKFGHSVTDEYEVAGAEDDLEGAEEYTGATLEERVLEAYMNDPVLSERAVDIGEIGEGIIELAGWVETEDEADHAVTLARGVPGVETVVNRLNVGEEEAMLDDNYERLEAGDPALTESHWEGQQVGTGRRRQGASNEVDRHADPRTEMEDKWLSEREAIKQAADSTEGIAERRRSSKKSARGDRTGGAPVAPTGVPKGDHVAEPLDAPQSGRGGDDGAQDAARAD